MNRKAQYDIARKLKVLNHATEHGNISKTCRYFGICRETFYKWKRAYETDGEEGLVNNKSCIGDAFAADIIIGLVLPT